MRGRAQAGVKTRASCGQGGDFGRVGRGRRGQCPRQQLVDLVDRVVRDLAQHRPQIGFGVAAVQFGGADQRVHRGGPFAARVGTGEQKVFSAESHRSQRALRGVVVDLSLIHI